MKTKSAFTLVELLVVIAVIAILVGIVSALLGGMSGKAMDTRARNLCAQTAEAWTLVSITENRLPGAALIEKTTDCTALGGDYAIRMTPSAIVLLNDWRKTSPLPAVDVAQFNVRVGKTDHLSHDDAVEFGCLSNGKKGSMQWRLEPDYRQLQWGLFAPWVQRKVNEEEEDSEEDSTAFDDAVWDKTKSANAAWGHGIVTVAIDADGDGLITIPAGTLDNADDLELRTTAVAWVWNEKKTRTIRSW